MSESKYIAESKDYSDKASYNREEKSRPIAIAEEKPNNSTSSKNNKTETKSTIDAKLEILLEDQAEVDAEFEALKLSPSKLAIKVNDNPVAKKIAQGLYILSTIYSTTQYYIWYSWYDIGLRINSICMRDANTGRLIWTSSKWGDDMYEREYVGA